MYVLVIKPFFDFLVSILIFVLISPLFLVVFFVLLFNNKGKSPFFVQKRPGKNAEIFDLIKFKTMRDMFNDHGVPLPDKDRITKVGQFIRKYSLDELPQFLNVIKGDMSLIGPRPLLVKYLSLYSVEQMRRHEVKPGITGWAQVNGRNALSWQEKFKLDIWYADNCNLLLDVRIFFLTIKKILIREGINASNAATMPPFTGNI